MFLLISTGGQILVVGDCFGRAFLGRCIADPTATREKYKLDSMDFHMSDFYTRGYVIYHSDRSQESQAQEEI